MYLFMGDTVYIYKNDEFSRRSRDRRVQQFP